MRPRIRVLTVQFGDLRCDDVAARQLDGEIAEVAPDSSSFRSEKIRMGQPKAPLFPGNSPAWMMPPGTRFRPPVLRWRGMPSGPWRLLAIAG